VGRHGPCSYVYPNLFDNTCLRRIVFLIKDYCITNGNRVGRGYVIVNFQLAFNARVAKVTCRIAQQVPAACRFIYYALQIKKSQKYESKKAVNQLPLVSL
jgi:hypothetical protein